MSETPYHEAIPGACPRCAVKWTLNMKWYVWLRHDAGAGVACGQCNYRFRTAVRAPQFSYWQKVAII